MHYSYFHANYGHHYESKIIIIICTNFSGLHSNYVNECAKPARVAGHQEASKVTNTNK